VNPLTLLIKPMIAAGLFITKLFVAVGYVATEGHDPAAQQKAAVEQVRVTVVPSESGLESMELEMPNGELFQLSSASSSTPGEERSTSPSARPYLKRTHTDARPDVVATLESTLGRTMQCEVSLPRETERGSARCKVQSESYDVVF
jgi:hypothetical protein